MAKQKTTTQRVRVGLRYIGAGDYFPGIPRRDLTEKDLVRYADAIAAVEGAGTLETLYEPVVELAETTNVAEEEASNG